jgi:hypothetical protein
MTEKLCLNCEGELAEGNRHCPQCGQKTAIHRFTILHIIHEFFHAFTHTDKGIFGLLKALTINPGKVISEYADGKRKKYFNPFTFFLLCTAFFVFVNVYFSPFGKVPEPDPKVLARIPSEEGKKIYTTAIKRSATVTKITQQNGNIIAMVALPFLSFINWLFFRRRKRNYAEIMVAGVFITAYSNLFFTLFITPLMAANMGQPAYFYLLFAGLFLQSTYFGWAMHGFLQMQYKWEIIKTWGANLAGVILWSFATALLAVWYISGSNFSLAIKGMLNKLLN